MGKLGSDKKSPRRAGRGYAYVRLIYAIVIIGLALLGFLIDILSSIFAGQYIDFYEISRDNIEPGTNVELYVDAVLDNYAYMSHTTNSIKTSVDEYYVIWLDDGDVISVSVNNEKTKKQFEELYEYTWNYLDNGGEWNPPYYISVKGKISKITGEMADFYQESLDYMGYGEDNGNILFLNIDGTKVARTHIIELIFFGIVEIILVVVLVMTIRKNKKVAAAEAEAAMRAGKYSQVPGFEDNNTYEPVGFDNVDFDSVNYNLVDVDEPFKNQDVKND